MNTYNNREDKIQLAAERLQRQREREQLEEKQFYERVTSGWSWTAMKITVIFCTLLSIVATIEYFIDGPTEKISETRWKVNREWRYDWHKVIDVDGYTFMPELGDWLDRKENTLSLTRSPIFRTGKKLNFLYTYHGAVLKQQAWRERSIFDWFPTFQLVLLIPLATYVFRRQSPWFNFARIVSMAVILPASLCLLFFTML